MIEAYLKRVLNNAWASGVLPAARQKLSAPDYWTERTGFFESIGRAMNHIYEVDLYNVGALEARGTGRVDSAKLYWSSTE